MAHIDCQCCGAGLEVTPIIPEGAQFACAHCGLILLNVPAARSFRWADLDPYIREHGASRANLWGGVAGSALWLIIFGVVTAARGTFRPGLMLALALPYLALLAVLFRGRARTPAALWGYRLWTGLGAYGVYLWLLLTLKPDWGEVFVAAGTDPYDVAILGIFGVVSLLVGLFASARYRRRAARLPQVGGTAA
jgi:hypothetical protein